MRNGTWATGLLFGLGGAAELTILVQPAWAIAAVPLSLILILAGWLFSRRRKAPTGPTKEPAWAMLADGLSRLAAGNLVWSLKARDDVDSTVRDCIQGFNDVTAEPCRRLFYVGSDSQEEGQLAGRAIGERLRKGRLAVLVGSADGINYELRRKGALTILRDHYPEIRETALLESRVDPEFAYHQVKKLLASDPQLSAIYVTEGGSPPGVARAVVEAGRAGVVLVFAHDVTPGTMEAMANGVIEATIFQDPFAQGFDPAVRIHNHLAEGDTPPTPRLSTQIKSVTAANSAEYWDRRQKKSLSGDRSRLVVPVPSSGREFRVAVIGLGDDGFWAEVKAGTLAAKETLGPLGTSVEWMVPPGNDEPERIASLGATLRRLMDERFDGVALPLHDRALVPIVNQAVAAGATVATYNTEPLSLRQTMSTVAAHAKSQFQLSADLDGLAQRGEKASASIRGSLSAMSEGLERQREQVEQTGADLETLAQSLKTIEDAARGSSEATRRVAQSAEESFSAVQETLGAMGDLDNSSKAIGQSVDELKHETARVAQHVALIGDIANRTNTLAINASIEAARAGASGKGFAVIASEIRHLSDQANEAASSIAGLLESIGGKVTHVETTTLSTLSETHRTHESALQSGRALGVIVAGSAESDLKMNEILDAVGEVVSFSTQIELVVKDLKRANETWNTAVNESLGAAGELDGTMGTIAQDAHSLSERSRSQEAMLRQFKLGEDV